MIWIRHGHSKKGFSCVRNSKFQSQSIRKIKKKWRWNQSIFRYVDWLVNDGVGNPAQSHPSPHFPQFHTLTLIPNCFPSPPSLAGFDSCHFTLPRRRFLLPWVLFAHSQILMLNFVIALCRYDVLLFLDATLKFYNCGP